MKKYALTLFLAVLLLFATVLSAEADHAHVYDGPDLISSENENKCELISQQIEESYGICVVFCFPAETEITADINAYCADVYANRVRAANALVFAHDLFTGTTGTYLAGNAKKVFTAEKTDALFALYNDSDSYHGGIENFLTGVADMLRAAYPDEAEAPTEATATEATTAAVRGEKEFVADHADLLTDKQEKALSEKLSALSEKYEADFVVLTEPTIFGRPSLAFADDYFDYNGYGQGRDRSGMLVLYVPGPAGEREIAISTRGSLYSCVSDADSDAIIDAMIPDLISEDYAAAFDGFASLAEEQAAEIGKARVLPLLYVPLSLLIGFAIAFLVLKMQTASLKSVRQERTARYYIQPGSLVLTGSFDRFLYKNVSKTPRQTQSSSSGTSGRISSSGATHGGTSRKF